MSKTRLKKVFKRTVTKIINTSNKHPELHFNFTLYYVTVTDHRCKMFCLPLYLLSGKTKQYYVFFIIPDFDIAK